MKISLCMIVKNEEQYIKMCIENALKLADEIIIVDTGSTDKTLDIIKEFEHKIKLIHFSWNNDFSEARNISLENATGDWILMLDADEKLLCDADAVRNILEHSDVEGYEIPLYNIISKTTVVYSAVYCKLFRNKGYRYKGAIHEQINIEGGLKNIKPIDVSLCKVIHYGYIADNVNQRDKTKRNLDILLEEQKKRPEDPFIYYNIGVCYEVEGEFKKALDNFFECNKLATATDKYSITEYEIDMVKRMAESYYGLQEYGLCIEFINDVLKETIFRKYVDLYFIIGNCYFTLKKYDDAIKAFKKAIDIGETTDFVTIKGRGSFQPKLLLARVYAQMGNVNAAAMEYIEAIFDPNNFVKEGLAEGRLYLKEHNYTEILDGLNKLIK